MNLAILASHLVACALGALVAFPRARSWVLDPLVFLLALLCVPIFGVIVLAMLVTDDHAGNGTTGAWYLIYSVVTLGVVPLVTHLCAVASGFSIRRILQFFRRPLGAR